MEANLPDILILKHLLLSINKYLTLLVILNGLFNYARTISGLRVKRYLIRRLLYFFLRR